MSGLLRRLAAQAGGQRGVTLHAPAHLPFQPAPERLESAESVLPAALPGAALPSLMERPVPSVVAPAPAVPPTQPRAARPEIPGEMPPAPATRAEEQPPALEATPPEPLLAEQPLSLFVQVPNNPGVPVQETAAPPTGSHPAVPRHEAPARTDATPPSPATPRLPTLLAPMAPATAPQPRVAPTQAEPTPRQPDEVHIHIGRIEVTAIQEAAPARREARKGPPPLSLDDYLARRNGERP
ncbi:hypothetical protein J2T41_004137 [Pseudomonas citronellolis]|uniref:hypothetical protein n=1 Tax=Pseudomonas citronellolis TaxID=53408 RepID=UPI0020A0B0FA|nr:hypothetical protein [Pseudomonas citronellolis]MCP1644499.1 hypothetical protein [Pseudomonas citronellolis]MCP1667374.1 hypothetical protein [Pseudomonas citronellolis]MCP1698451.1 hypothetical protein [Pseudomonas citronellolis]MCP1706126.1 hypothetical protein [Pseudomonas citronellolis]MCP1798923.1 hypothetical protein [Pseudomonas citronellolis]